MEVDEVDLSIHEKFIADCEAVAAEAKHKRTYQRDSEELEQGPSAREIADNKIREAEAAKACMFAMPGNNYFCDNQCLDKEKCTGSEVVSYQRASTAMDDNYIMIGGNNVDISMQEKIIKGKYVDFAQLIP